MGFECWVSKVLKLSATYGIDPMTHTYSADTKRIIKRTIREYFIKTWHSDLQNLSKYPILRTYNLFKRSFEREHYLSSVLNPKYRIAISKLRCSSHTLEIERGRYTIPVTPADKRLCNVCMVVEDELHFLLHCTLYSKDRQALYTRVCEHKPQFTDYADLEKIQYLLDNKDNRIITLVGKFIHNSFIARCEYYRE